MSAATSGIEIAVIGMAGRFPGAKNLDQFWQNLCEGVESIKFFTDEELLAKGVEARLLDDPNYVKAEAILDDIEMFDASFFDFTPREASLIDPQHRLFLEQAWEALENAGYAAERNQRTGVYAGESINSYLLSNLYPNRELMESAGGFQVVINNDRDYLATHIAYKLNLTGPALSVQTACSTSLVAVHLACQGLLNRECDMALAGGVSVGVPQGEGAFHQEGGIISPDGHCRAFDAHAQGTVKGNGVGVVVLKRLGDALRDGDTVHAIIKGTAINNDGSLKVGFTAPSIDGQASVIEEALALAEIEPQTVTYIETHGTGTPLGDPIEVAALTQAFRTQTGAKNYCALGSVKTNIGHTDAAAGVAGLIKTVLALEHKQLPPSLNFSHANPNIDFAGSPFFVNTELTGWQTNGMPRRAGVSSFGIGGTNVHVVLEEAARVETRPAGTLQLLTLSTKTATALEAARVNLAAYLKQNAEINLADVAFTLQTGRRSFAHRLAFVCRDAEEAAAALEEARQLHIDVQKSSQNPPVAFMFTGQGAQYVQMARELYETERSFREVVDHCCEILKPQLRLDLRDVLYPPAERAEEASEQLKQTQLTQPALFVIEYALAQLWMRWGVRPAALIGHSIGEYVAACIAGIFTLEDALQIVVERGRLMEQAPPGGMLAVPLSEKEILPLLNGELSLAAVNAPSLCVVSGTVAAVDQLERELGVKDLICRRLHTSHALHSAMMDPLLAAFAAKLKEVKTSPPQIPIVSTLTATWMTAEEASNANYWARQLRQTVRFADGLGEILKEPATVLLEIGPGQTLSALANQQGTPAKDRVVLSSLRHPRDSQSDVAYILHTLAGLWTAGVEIDWAALHAHEPERRRIPLPTYPFERRRYWIDPPDTSLESKQIAALKRRDNPADYLYVPSWKRTVHPVLKDKDTEKSCWVVFADPCGVGAQVVRRLESEGKFVINVMASEQFDKLGERAFALNPHHRGNYESLMKEIRALDRVPARIVHLWGVTPDVATPSNFDWYTETQGRGFYSLIYLAQVLGEHGLTDEVQIEVVTNHLQEVTGAESLLPEKATVLGPCKVIPQEYANIKCRVVDISLPAPGSVDEERLAENLIGEFAALPSEDVVAYRGRHRWLQVFEPLRVVVEEKPRLRDRGVYLLTGSSDIDFALARYLAEAAHARLILLGDEAFPEREVHALEEAGAEVLILNADFTSGEAVAAIISQARARFGEINGVIHSASVTSGGMIQLKTKEMVAPVFAPKVLGTRALQSALESSDLDFFVLFSTSLALTGVFGQVDYCAANAFLDAFAHANALHGNFTASIDWHVPQWETWQQESLASVPLFQTQFAETREAYGIKLDEGVALFRHLLSSSQPQVIVSTQDFQALIDEQQRAASMSLLDQLQASVTVAHTRTEADGDYVAPQNEVEASMAALWEELFGLQRLSVNDNFFELGGNSLLGIQLISRVRKDFQIELPLNTLFESPTAAGLAAAIAETRLREKEAEEIERLLREIESLSPAELQATLAQELKNE
ncbi:MAG TPA: SDR family NAD(P)-dependent oxidoreductase [Pyrinomonadaceae bacterium]|nr:SDR family NAD(P)-dependent oxidoreductase [Pyrinomonadaceae bacterium]